MKRRVKGKSRTRTGKHASVGMVKTDGKEGIPRRDGGITGGSAL